MGYAACEAASSVLAEGCVGAGMGASVGKLGGIGSAMKSGVGSWSATLADGTCVAALAVVNAFGDVYDEQGQIIAGMRDERGGFANISRLLREGMPGGSFGPRRDDPQQVSNTTIAVVATDATLSKAEATKLAQMAHDGLARSIRPVHTPFDGDTIFALATQQRPPVYLVALGSLAADVLAEAVRRAVRAATPMAGLAAYTP
jgi:L-aminopeptidase/D-esterase-like protein